ncbi:hypothetical protein FE257_011423 [Aspergillus nanangensis]|uniref:Cytochrome P450 n=1 Tax=Aspergillus nanangensis TaxID=2582783 RepID=A0AAD4CHE5_ASPNN|nr:hypothetical protein FE257_011423 [Aspergillus nanangensis]
MMNDDPQYSIKGAGSLYVFLVVVYRLYLSPLARFPGPRLAAATGLYETYFQIIKGGVYTWEIDRLHEEYGPIIRVKPNELHIKDPDYYNTVYAGPGKHRNKDLAFSNITFPQSLFSTAEHAIHSKRRGVLGQFFKKNAIATFEPVIQANTNALCRHFTNGAQTSLPLELHTAFECFSSDTISQYAFGHQDGFHYLDEPALPSTWKNRITSMFELCRVARHFPMLGPLGRIFPAISMRVCPKYKHVYEFEKDVRARVRNAIAQHAGCSTTNVFPHLASEKGTSPECLTPIYRSILADPTVRLSEKESCRLEEDALFLMMAGTDAPSQALAITMFHILNNPEVYHKLKAELVAGIVDVTVVPTLGDMEQLPYLTATIREGLRLSSIVTSRLPRSAPDEDLWYQEWRIPAGTLVSMSTYFILRDSNIFPEPTRFIPERWLVGPEDLQRLQRYLVPASKGSLGCLGQNMNWSFMHIVIGTILRRFDLALYDTTEKNVEMTRDNFIGQTDPGMNVVQVRVLEQYLQ